MAGSKTDRQDLEVKKSTVLVTVGTTKFEALSKAADSIQFVETLRSSGYRKLVLQIGSSDSFFPSVLFGEVEGVSKEGTVTFDGFEVEYFRYAPTLKERIEEAALVISHAGAGSVFESLRAGKRLIAVPNGALMDNHQADLCGYLKEKGFMEVAEVGGLGEAVVRMGEELDGGWLKRYVSDDGRGIGRAIGQDYARRSGRG